MIRRHPSRARLQRWLDTDESLRAYRRVERHVNECDQCQVALDELSELDEGIVADLHAATAPPDDLAARTHQGVDDRLRDEAAIGVFLDLFTIGWDVMRTILDPTNEAEDAVVTDGDDPHPTQNPADEADGGNR